ncbi:MAG: UDP-N-acetylmuramoyl-L-alanyl-D-glutamate--2,6-diaminopimelate ligase [Actinomycetes bacterium]
MEVQVQFRDLLVALDGRSDRPGGSGAGDGVTVRSVEHDHRRVHPGACFACIPGARFDGHDFAPAAVVAGAVALIVERPLGLGVPEIRVADVRAALGAVAARLYGDPSRALRCLGVTGTNGKTTTTHLLHAIATAAGERAGYIGTTGARIGDRNVPLSFTTPEASDLQALLAEMRDDGVTTVAMEVSSHALVQHRVDATWFAAACFTNLSRDHLDYHGTMDDYFAAKATLFVPERCGVVVTNLDDAHGARLVEIAAAGGLASVTYAVDDGAADLGVEGRSSTTTGSTFTLVDRRHGRRAEVALGLVGRLNVANACAAAATALAVGFRLDDVARGLSQAPVVPGRLERVDAGQPFTVLVDYAHTPDALVAAIAAARATATATGGRVGIVFGCGGDRDPGKRPEMGAAAAAADHVVVTSDNPRSEDPATIAAAAVAGARDTGATPEVELDRRLAIRRVLAWASPGDVVLVAGKGHESGQTLGSTTVAFDDREVVREELLAGARAESGSRWT